MCVNKKVSTSSIDRQFNSYVYSTRWKEKWQLNVRIRSSYASTSYGLCIYSIYSGRNVTTDVTCMRVVGRRIINTLAALEEGKRKKKGVGKRSSRFDVLSIDSLLSVTKDRLKCQLIKVGQTVIR